MVTGPILTSTSRFAHGQATSRAPRAEAGKTRVVAINSHQSPGAERSRSPDFDLRTVDDGHRHPSPLAKWQSRLSVSRKRLTQQALVTATSTLPRGQNGKLARLSPRRPVMAEPVGFNTDTTVCIGCKAAKWPVTSGMICPRRLARVTVTACPCSAAIATTTPAASRMSTDDTSSPSSSSARIPTAVRRPD
jgi:hypothetical protein